MQENKAKISNDKQLIIKQVKEEKLLVAYYNLVQNKLKKLQIASTKVISLA